MNTLGKLFEKGLYVGIPSGVSISIYEYNNDKSLSDVNHPTDYTCAGKMTWHIFDNALPAIAGAIGGVIWPVSVPLYAMWKYETVTGHKLCNNNEENDD